MELKMKHEKYKTNQVSLPIKGKSGESGIKNNGLLTFSFFNLFLKMFYILTEICNNVLLYKREDLTFFFI